MKATSLKITRCGECLEDSAPNLEQAVKAAKVYASRYGKSVTITATLDDGCIRQVICKPDGTTQKLWEADHVTYSFEGEDYATLFPEGTSTDRIFTHISREICFGDCTGVDVHEVVIDGKQYTYGSWKPGMVFEFYYTEGHLAWQGCFPHWDH